MLEFVIGRNATVMLNKEDAKYGYTNQITGWSVAPGEGGMASFKGREANVAAAGRPHQVFTDGKILKDINAVCLKPLISLLRYLSFTQSWRIWEG